MGDTVAESKEHPLTHSGGKPHTNIGDIGQRYEVRTTGYPKATEATVGWAATFDGAEDMMTSFCQAPGCLSATIYDREEKRTVITRYAGILR